MTRRDSTPEEIEQHRAMNRTARKAERELRRRHPEEFKQIQLEIRIQEGLLRPTYFEELEEIL